ncbi:sulfotransferase family protein [Catalinimonas locisalis]|uniref:sulfotransferase family protein n=1 Tax=Catalinimonas locisalis TaxID=3133978 RepID=UPI0031013C20
MKLKVIGFGLGRTGTYSLKTALEALQLGPCHHMERVAQNMPVQLPLWNEALDNSPNFEAIYAGMQSAVDWPTAAFYQELYATYPNAKFILTHRSKESWAESFGSTIYKLLAEREKAPPPVQEWLNMVVKTIKNSGFPMGLDFAGLAERYEAHNQVVQDLIPADQLLIYQVKEGWEPLCRFLGLDVPTTEFPRTNNREEFWDLVNAATKPAS